MCFPEGAVKWRRGLLRPPERGTGRPAGDPYSPRRQNRRQRHDSAAHNTAPTASRMSS